MKQPEDRFTIEFAALADLTLSILAPAAPAKRGRGRPRKANALTPAQRAQRYRMRRAAGAAA